MRRGGSQHGMVRTRRILPNLLNPRPDNRPVNRFNSPTTAKFFIRVPSKPTNHSKFTGKCGQPRCNGCHLRPTCKAKGKTKGNQKLKASNLVSNHKLFDFRGVDARPGLSFSGVSATRILDQLSSFHVTDDDEVSDYDGDDDQVYDYDGRCGAGNDDIVVDSQSVQATAEINNACDDQSQNGDEEEKMSFCVGPSGRR